MSPSRWVAVERHGPRVCKRATPDDSCLNPPTRPCHSCGQQRYWFVTNRVCVRAN